MQAHLLHEGEAGVCAQVGRVEEGVEDEDTAGEGDERPERRLARFWLGAALEVHVERVGSGRGVSWALGGR